MALSLRSEAIRCVRAVTLLAVAGVVAIPGLAKADETWTPGTMLSVSGLTSFDISWVDYGVGSGLPPSYWLADRSNKAIDRFVIPAANGGLTQYTANFVGAFVGPTGAVNNDLSGPNGVLTVPAGHTGSGFPEVWAGDGPQVNIGCPGFLGGKCSSVKVINPLFPGLGIRVIPTGGAARADELCFDSVDNVVLIANDAEADFSFGTPFISVISTETYQVVANMQIPQTTNGIEQCKYDHQLGLFFINIPEVGGTGADTANGNVLVLKFTPASGGTPAKIAELGAFIIPNNNCAGPQGMAIADPFVGSNSTNPQMLLGCNAVSLSGPLAGLRNSVILNKFTGAIIATGPGLGGADEAWANDTHYYVTGSSCAVGSSACFSNGPQWGTVDFGAPLSPSTDQITAITPVGGVSSHSIASDCNIGHSGEVFLPVAGGVQVFNVSPLDSDDPPAGATVCQNNP